MVIASTAVNYCGLETILHMTCCHPEPGGDHRPPAQSQAAGPEEHPCAEGRCGAAACSLGSCFLEDLFCFCSGPSLFSRSHPCQ